MPAKPKSRKLVVLCDGTSNEIKDDLTNVLRLYHCVDNSKGDIVFYDPGVGTVGAFTTWSKNWLWVRLRAITGLAFGRGLDQNVLKAYQFLIDNWQPGDKIYLFGFSRGAYTVRVLAALVYTLGILDKEQSHLKNYALNSLKDTSFSGDFANLKLYQDTVRRKQVTIEFLGVWDTVSSVFIWNRMFFRTKNIGYTRKNASIKTVRHAMSIDERRRFYRQYDWLPGEPATTLLPNNPKYYNKKLPRQNVKEVWFAGAHTDAGGGYRDARSMVPKIAYEWLLREAAKFGLPINNDVLDYQLGSKPDEKGQYLSKPDPAADLYNSLTWLWWILELFPKWRRINKFRSDYRKDNWSVRDWFDFYIPLGERRNLTNRDAPDDAKILIHDSVQVRLQKTGYNPPNLPEGDKIEWVATSKR